MVKPVDPQSITGIWTYVSSIDWSEPWLIALVFFHLSCFASIIVLRKHGSMQAFVFFPLLLIVFFSESINEWASKNWRMFSSEQYFDSRGLFISTVLSAPILLNCLIVAMMWVYYSGELMVQVKRAQLRGARKPESSSESSSKKDK